ncbi:MAG TPA: hypothetical protein HPP77_02940, partial [Candidatus Hydrogenedentes bacterium]|nr:hypothetical protein [Candidatus Hydrogenedentota bacterium]
MESLRSWAVILPRLLRYVFVYRLFRIGACPTIMDCRPECMRCLLDLFHWDRKVRLVDAEQCPRKGPAVFVANHIKRDDPFVEWQAIQVASNGGILPRIMMRDDFFGNIAFLKSRLLDGNELTAMLGSLHISRGRVGLSQIIPFIKVLCEEDSFLMYPSGTRSRSGLFVEYRDGFEEPGAVSLFVAQAQRRRPDLEVAVVPMTRTYNPVTGKSALIFCAPQSLPHGADRTAQRAFDA